MIMTEFVFHVSCNETPQKRIYDNLVSFGGSVFRFVRVVQRKRVCTVAISQVSTVQNNQYTKGHFLRWCILLPFIIKNF